MALAAVSATPASGDVASRKQAIDARLQRVQAKIAWAAAARARRSPARSPRSTARSAPSPRRSASSRRDSRRSSATSQLHQEKLDKLTELFRAADRAASTSTAASTTTLLDRLGNRLVDLYENGEPSSLEVLFDSKSVTDLIDAAQVVDSLNAQDRSIAGQVGNAKERVRVQREHTKRFRSLAAAEVRTIGIRTQPGARAARPAAREREPAGRRSRRPSARRCGT